MCEEYRFEYKGPKVADVALIRSNGSMIVFEICHTHRTADADRPEPWFELDARSIEDNTDVVCIRKAVCEECWKEDMRVVMGLEENERDVFDVYPDAEGICISPWFAEHFYEAHLNAVDWFALCASMCVSFSFYTQHIESIDWDGLCSRKEVPLWFYSAYVNELNWEMLCKREDIPREFFKSHLNRIDLNVLKRKRLYCSSTFLSAFRNRTRIDLAVPYHRKGEAKQLDAQWDGETWWTRFDNPNLSELLRRFNGRLLKN